MNAKFVFAFEELDTFFHFGNCGMFVGEKLWEVQCDSPTFTVAWHPKRPLLAYACDDKEGKYDNNREAGTVKLFGLPNDS